MSGERIPAAILGYAEVIVDTRTGRAHLPQHFTYPIRTRQRWSATESSMITEDVLASAYRPRCYGAPSVAETPEACLWSFSAGWADHVGYAGCPDCWPETPERTT